MLELARQGVQGLVNGVHVDAGQDVLERLGLTVHGMVDRWLLCCKGERQKHERYEQNLKEIDSQHNVGGQFRLMVCGWRLKWRKLTALRRMRVARQEFGWGGAERRGGPCNEDQEEERGGLRKEEKQGRCR